MPSGMGYGAQEGLQDVLARLFLEAKEKQRQKEAADQLTLDQRSVAVNERNAAANEGIRQATLEATKANQVRLDEDRDEQRFQGKLRMLPKGSRLNPQETVEFAKRGYSGLMKPVQNEPAFEFAGTQDTENKENTLAAQTRHREIMEEVSRGRLDVAQAMAEVAKLRASWGPTPITINTSDASGNAVTKVVPRGQATGQEFPAAPTTDERNRKASSGRAAPVLQAISELSERINVGQGVAAKITGEVERKKAQVNLNDDISEYEAVVSGFTPLLARAVGHSGVLTEQDVQSVRKMLPAPGDSKSVRDRKVARIQTLLGDLGGTAQANSGTPAPAVPTAPSAQDLINKYRKQP